MQAIARYVMRGRLQAVLVTAVTALLSLLLPPLNYISSAVVGLVTLRKGWSEGLIVIAGAGVATAVFAVLTPVDPYHADLVAAAIWVPVWVLAIVLRYTVSLSATVGSAGIIGAVVVIGTYLVLDDPAQSWRNIMGRIVALAKQQDEPVVANSLGQMLEHAAPHLTGMLIGALVLGLTLSLFLARWWQALLFNPGGFSREFRKLRLSRNFALLTVVALAVSMVAPQWPAEVAANVLIVLVVVYLMHGMGLVHGIVAAKGLHVGWLIAVYVATFILPQSTLLLAAGAFADSWLDIRKRIKKPASDQGGQSDQED
ncbi:MAG: DUF2232 domain-containing protein [Gammaproteobacteria bacterium]